jgi:serine/threonine protein kinase/Tol biopolymer transport system component
MGEVYRARDVRLDRTVAVKILRSREAEKSEAKERFDREARAISSLNHPNICHLYDVGEQDGVRYLVMEYLEGQTVAECLSKGPLSLERVLKHGIEICEGLEKAHRDGVIHRDLKPGNVMLTKTGVKLMDFGLAKYVTPPSSAPTQSTQDLLTAEGTVLGTLQYMAPEQLEGKDVSRQSDIFSFGAVLYEMATGKRAFEGKSQLSVMTAILEEDPPRIRSVKPTMPPALDHAIGRCLMKDREERWQTAHDLSLELKWIAEGDSGAGLPAPAASRHKLRERLAWVVAAVLALGCLALIWGFLSRTPQPVRVLRSSLLPPPGSSFLPYNFAIAPDGSRLAFVALGPDGKTALWVRALSSSNAQQFEGTEGATFPFWSPDGLHVGFFAQGRLKAIDLANSAVQNLCDASAGSGGTWNRDGVIVFAPGMIGPLYRVPATGGTPEQVTKVPVGSAQSHHWPWFLPDGKHFLYFVNWSGPSDAQGNGIYVASLDGDKPKLISADFTGNVFFASGHLLYIHNRIILAQPFDTRRLQTTGPALRLTQEEVDKFFDFWQAGFSVSEDGKLVFQSAADDPTRLVWYDAAGHELGQFPEVGYEGPQFSHDGRSLAVSSDDEHNGKHFIRIYDLERAVSTRLTDGGSESNPVWSPDGKSLAFRDASLNIEVVPADGSGPPRPLVTGTNVIPCDWSADGHLVYMSVGAGAFPSLDVYSALDHRSTQFAKSGAESQFSPDGKWIVYIGMPGRRIVVQPFPGPGAHIQISVVPGSTQPRWSRDGRKIFFVQPDRKLMVAAFDPVRKAASPPQLFAQTRVAVTMFGWFQYDVPPNGRLLVNSLPSNTSSPLTLIAGWDALIPKPPASI